LRILRAADFDEQAPGITGAEDPYSGIFFPTSRREEIIEVLPPPSAADHNGEHEVLSFGEWMSGCPEKGEQDFLFNLWRDETEHPVVCSCGWKRERSPHDFFTLLVRPSSSAIFRTPPFALTDARAFSQPTFPEYLAKIACDVHLRCPSCSRRICLACGEDDVGNGGSFDAEGIDKGKGKDKATSAVQTGLFHCAKLQGVVLGVGASLAGSQPHWKLSLTTNAWPPPRSHHDLAPFCSVVGRPRLQHADHLARCRRDSECDGRRAEEQEAQDVDVDDRLGLGLRSVWERQGSAWRHGLLGRGARGRASSACNAEALLLVHRTS